MDISFGVSGTLRAQMDGHPPCVLAAGFCTEHSAASRSIGYEEECAPTLRAGTIPAAIALESHPMDGRVKIDENGSVQTLTSRMGTGGMNVPLLLKMQSSSRNNNQTPLVPMQAYDICIKGGSSPRSKCEEVDISRTLDCGMSGPVCNQGGIAVVEGPTYAMTTGSYTQVSEEQSPTLMARDFKDPTVVNQGYRVRKLTATECARLQGFPAWWCSGLETPEPTEEDIAFWAEVWETHRRVAGRSTRPKSRNQIIKWLKNPYSEAAEYAMWGNGVALPNVFFVLAGIVWAAQLPGQ